MNIRKFMPVKAQWALWGQDVRSSEYGVLAHSVGAIDGENFEEVFGRYSLGTLDSLPQVTIGWMHDAAANDNLISLAIHDKHVLTGPDADEAKPGQIVLTRLFCVPYRDLAAGAVSYQAMYAAFDPFVPPMTGTGPIPVELPETLSTRPPIALDPSVLRAAALLLTGKPVCVVGADEVSVADRLRFIDSVAWLLPYGLRSRLSASTWVSGLVTQHRLRLYFTSSRQSGDAHHVVSWGVAPGEPIDDVMAADYLRMLNDSDVRLRRLAEYTEPIDFKPGDIGNVMMYVTGLAGVEAVLRSCAAGLDVNPARLQADIDLLRRRLGDPLAPEQRGNYAGLIKELRLFRPSPRVDSQLLAGFYDVLLRLAFPTPLGYRSYCDIEESTGLATGTSLPEPLLHAMRKVGLRDSPDLLVSMAISEDEVRDTLRRRELSAEVLVSAAADTRVRPHHAKVMCEIIAKGLVGQPGHQDRKALRTALSDQGYLAPMLESRFPDEQNTQVSLLSGMLRAAYGRKLTSGEAADVLGTAQGKPTAALVAATVMETDRRDIPRVADGFSTSFADTPSAATADEADLPRESARSDAQRQPGRRELGISPKVMNSIIAALAMILIIVLVAVGVFIYFLFIK